MEARFTGTRFVAATLLISVCSGCYATWDIPHRELAKLDGYHAPETVTVVDTGGERVEFGPRTQIVASDGERTRRFQLDAAQVSQGVFYGYVSKPKGAVVQIPLRPDGTVRLVHHSAARTALAIALPCAVGATLLLVLIASRGFGHP